MGINVVQWRCSVGMFNCRRLKSTNDVVNNPRKNLFILFEVLFVLLHYSECFFSLLTLLYLFTFLKCHGDIEINPGPRKLKTSSLSVCHWNLNSLCAHNHEKLTQLKAYNSLYKYDFICLSETFLDSSIPDDKIKIEGYELVRDDHPDHTKRGGVCIYYRESLPVQEIKISYFKEALLLEMNYNHKKVIVSVIYRSPSQSNIEFDLFLANLEQLLCEINNRKPYLSIITGDFNARSSSWWSKDSNTPEGLKFFSLTSANGFSQLINEPTHFQGNSSSCIDLSFTSQGNLSVNSGVHTSLHPKCKHQIIHSSFNLNIYYPPPYHRLIWDYEKADPLKISKAFDSVNWERLFGQHDINQQVKTLNEVLLNIFRNYLPNKYIIIDDKDPVWMNDTVKSKIIAKNLLFKQYIKNGRFESDFMFLETIANELNQLISSTKALYYDNLAKKLNNPLLQAKRIGQS